MEVTLDPVSKETVSILQWLHHENFNVDRGEQFYDAVTKQHMSFAFLAKFDDANIGEICIVFGHERDDNVLYISSLSVLAAYRGSGIGDKLLTEVLASCTSAKKFYLHVRVSNVKAIGLYQKHGFSIFRRCPAYYGDEDALLMRAFNLSHCPEDCRRRM
jgi:ribosomal protein S18 acetylase RimI-like enzyme